MENFQNQKARQSPIPEKPETGSDAKHIRLVAVISGFFAGMTPPD